MMQGVSPATTEAAAGTHTPSISPSQLLHLAETHLRLGNFSLCRDYALETLKSNPASLPRETHRNASQISAVAEVLNSAVSQTLGTTNWYTVLRLDTFCSDLTLIRTHFKNLILLLDPMRDKSRFVNEAIDLAWKAWAVLSNPEKKSQLDQQLQVELKKLSNAGGGGSVGDDVDEDSFWTFCPYCCYMYEYDRVFEGCCLRCQNGKCRRAFHGVLITLPGNWKYQDGDFYPCYGYFPMGYSGSETKGGNGSGFASWSPVVGMVHVENGLVMKNSKDNLVEISDESDEPGTPADVHSEGRRNRDTECRGDTGTEPVGNTATGAASHVGMVSRKKSVARNTRKMMGTGNRHRVNDNVTTTYAANRVGENRGRDEDEEVTFRPTGVGECRWCRF